MLRSPFNGEVFRMDFIAGVPPTLDTMLQAGYVLQSSKSKSGQKEIGHGTSEADRH